MRLLFTCRPSFGHIQPLLPLARAAKAAGHNVVFGTAAVACGRLEAEGFRTAVVGGPPDPGLASMVSGVDAPPLEQFRLVAFTRYFANSELKNRLVDLEPLVQSFRPDVIVHEIAELAAPLVAAAAEVPLITVGFGPLLDPGVASAAAAVVEPLWVERGLQPPRWAGLYRDLYLDPCPPSLQIEEVGALPRVEAMQTQDGEPGPPIDLFPDQHRQIVYVTFGTIFNKRMSIFGDCVTALRQLPVRVIVTVGEDVDPAQLGPMPDSIRVLRFVPQASILGSCALVISHAGAGTMLGALAFAVPMVLLPQGADQLYNAERCSFAGAATMLRPKEASVSAIATAAATVLGNPLFTQRARAIASEIKAMATPAQAMKRIEQLRSRPLS